MRPVADRLHVRQHERRKDEDGRHEKGSGGVEGNTRPADCPESGLAERCANNGKLQYNLLIFFANWMQTG